MENLVLLVGLGHAISVGNLIVLAFGDQGIYLLGECIEAATAGGVVLEKYMCLVRFMNSGLAAGFLL
jgi:hypothetical protein